MCKLLIQWPKRISLANKDPVLLLLLVEQVFTVLAGHLRTPTLVILQNSHLQHIYSLPPILVPVPLTHTGHPAPTPQSLNQQHKLEPSTAMRLGAICIPWSAVMQLVCPVWPVQRGPDGRDFGKRSRSSTI